MGIVSIDDIEDGMVLAADLLGSNGRKLLPKGAILQLRHRQTLKAWGVAAVDIEGDTPEASATEVQESVDEKSLQQSHEYLKPFFFGANLDHPAMAELHRLAVLRCARQFYRGWEPPATMAAEVPSGPARGSSDFPKTAAGLLQNNTQLTSLPDVYSRIVEVMNSPRSSASHLADMVSKDSSLASRLLTLVNSAFYGFPARIDTVSRAITLIGTNELTTMALGISVVRAFGDIPSEVISMEGFWKHSIVCGLFARLLAARKVGISVEQCFVGGLLHDIGRLVMLKEIPFAQIQALHLARKKRIPVFEAEKEILGYSHATVGALLCQQWRFSKVLEEMISYHHVPSRGLYALGCSLVHVANIMAEVYFSGQPACGSVTVPPLDEKAWQGIDLSPDVLAPIFAQADQLLHEIVRLFLGDSK